MYADVDSSPPCTRRSIRPHPVGRNCFYNSTIAALSEHPLFKSGELSQRIADELVEAFDSKILTVDVLKNAIVQSPMWSERVIGMYRTWMDMDSHQKRKRLGQYTERFPAFAQYVSTSDATTIVVVIRPRRPELRNVHRIGRYENTPPVT